MDTSRQKKQTDSNKDLYVAFGLLYTSNTPYLNTESMVFKAKDTHKSLLLHRMYSRGD